MNTYGKILAATLPLVFFFLFITVGTTYYFSRTALTNLATTWLETRLSEAFDKASEQESILHQYGLESIPASIIKAKIDAATNMNTIKVGEQGYIFAVNLNGQITVHPDNSLIGADLSKTKWFQSLVPSGGKIRYRFQDTQSLAVYDFFKPWGWFLLATDPLEEVYGVTNDIKPYLIYLGLACFAVMSLALMLLARQITNPLQMLTQGAERIGKGDLNTRIHISKKDEFGRLADMFNQMGQKLQESLTALKHSEEHFRSLIENAADIIAILDVEGRIVYGSPSVERTLGYTSESIVGKSILDLINPDEHTKARERIKRSVIKEIEINEDPTEYRIRHKDGSWKIIEVKTQNLLDAPAVKGLVVNARDITLRKQAETELMKSHAFLERRVAERTVELTKANISLKIEVQNRKQKERELKAANEAKSEFLANVSHEIRTPLNSVIGFSELLGAMVKDERQKSYVKSIEFAGKSLLTLINDILDLSKLEAGMMEINCSPVSLRYLFADIRELFRFKTESKSLQFFVSIAPDIPEILMLDDIRLRQILLNIVGNAVKFTGNGEVRLMASLSGTQRDPGKVNLTIRVQDTGIGIPEEKQKIIFDSFKQGSAGTSRDYGGTGLGLAISKRLTELMGGTITVKSNLNKGSIFELMFFEIAVGKEKTVPRFPSPSKDTDAIGREFAHETIDAQNTLSGIAGPIKLIPEKHPYYKELKEELQTLILPGLHELQESLTISAVKSTAEVVKSLGLSFESALLISYGKEMMDHADVFDIRKIEHCIKRLIQMIESC